MTRPPPGAVLKRPTLPNTSISKIWAILFAEPGVLSVIVIFTNPPEVGVKVYFSGEVVVPVLVPESTFVKVLPSVESDMIYRYECKFPSAQEMLTPHSNFWAPS
jgi:hypothetical protein